MKLKVLIAALFVAGFASSFALAGGTRAAVDTTTGTTGTTTTGTTGTTTASGTTTGATTTGTTTTTPAAPKCQKVELKGSNGTGSVTFTVDKSSKKASDLVGKPATLTVPAGAVVQATACRDAAGVLTLRSLELSVKKTENKGKDEGDNQNGQNGQSGKKSEK